MEAVSNSHCFEGILGIMPSAKERLFGLEDGSYLAKRAHLTMMMHINHMIYVESRTLNNPPMNTRIELLVLNLE